MFTNYFPITRVERCLHCSVPVSAVSEPTREGYADRKFILYLVFVVRWLRKYLLTVSSCACLIGLMAVTAAYGASPSPNTTQSSREFDSSFEDVAEFSGFYIVPNGQYESRHELSTERVHDGKYAHKAWITAARAADNDGWTYRPHRAYPTIQFQKTPGGVYRTPCLVSLWVWLDMTLQKKPRGQTNDWFSFLTLSPDTSDNWTRTVVVDLAPEGYALLVHVPRQGLQNHIYQASALNDPDEKLKVPQKRWVRLDVYIDFASRDGYAKVWQDGMLISHGLVEGGTGSLAQAHFGLYAAASIASGVVYNDNLRVREVANEDEAQKLVSSPL